MVLLLLLLFLLLLLLLLPVPVVIVIFIDTIIMNGRSLNAWVMMLLRMTPWKKTNMMMAVMTRMS